MTIAPGWYPDGSGAVRRWDGSAWTQEVRPGPEQRPPLRPWWFVLSTVLRWALAVTTAVTIANIFVSAAAWQTFQRWAARPRRADIERIETYNGLVTGFTVAIIVLYLVVGALFITWLYVAHASDRMDPGLLEHASGWAIGGWFVPILNFWRPYQVVEDVQRGAQTPGDRLSHLPLWWWLPWVVSGFGPFVTNLLTPTDHDSRRLYWAALARANLADVIGSSVSAVAAIAGVLLVRHLTELVRVSPHARA